MASVNLPHPPASPERAAQGVKLESAAGPTSRARRSRCGARDGAPECGVHEPSQALSKRGTALFNVPMAVRQDGPLDVAVLERALREAVRRHEVLRTPSREDASGPVQVVSPEPVLTLERRDLTGAPQDEARRLAREAPTWRGCGGSAHVRRAARRARPRGAEARRSGWERRGNSAPRKPGAPHGSSSALLGGPNSSGPHLRSGFSGRVAAPTSEPPPMVGAVNTGIYSPRVMPQERRAVLMTRHVVSE